MDFDATLAEWNDWSFAPGQPIPAMVERVRTALAEGKKIRLFTARVWPDGQTAEQLAAQLSMLKAVIVYQVSLCIDFTPR